MILGPYTVPGFVTGDARALMAALPDGCVQCVVTSPPYWGLRRYAGEQDVVWGGDASCGHKWSIVLPPRPGRGNKPGEYSTSSLTNPARQDEMPRQTNSGCYCARCGAWRGSYGNEPTPEMYVEHTVEILRAIRRVLREDGVAFWNVGDSYATPKIGNTQENVNSARKRIGLHDMTFEKKLPPGLKPKDLCLIPWRVALAAQADGWYVRSVIAWTKPNPMPESVTDRPTSAWEPILMLTKSERYYWDAEGVREQATHAGESVRRCAKSLSRGQAAGAGIAPSGNGTADSILVAARRNLRNVWPINSEPYREAHFACFPSEIPRRCIKAASRPGDVVLDPFCGSGTTCMVAEDLGRLWLGFDIAEEYRALQSKRTEQVSLVRDLMTKG